MVEMERKWLLLKAPDPRKLSRRASEIINMTQTYLLLGDEGTHRVRRSLKLNSEVLELVRKTPLPGGVKEELSWELTPQEYSQYLEQADPNRGVIRKTRFVVPFGNLNMEFDYFRTPQGLKIVEIEFPTMATFRDSVSLPSWVGNTEDVTFDSRYSNAALARALKEGNFS